MTDNKKKVETAIIYAVGLIVFLITLIGVRWLLG